MIGMIAIDYMYHLYNAESLFSGLFFFQDFLCLHCAILCILTRIDVLSRAVSTNVRHARAGSEKDEAGSIGTEARVMQRRLDE